MTDDPFEPIELDYFLLQQSDLQRKMPSPHPTELFLNAFDAPEYALLDEDGGYENTDADRKPAIDFIHWNVTAATDELHELLGEIGWKPWAKSRHINLEAARGEWIDALHFMLNLALVLGMDGEMIKALYDGKHAKNAKRQEEGYDGVSTKCPGCKRALDDNAVQCGFNKAMGENIFWCTEKLRHFQLGEDGLFRQMKETRA